MALAPRAGYVRMTHPDLAGVEKYRTLASFRNWWFANGWRAPEDDPDYDGIDGTVLAELARFRDASHEALAAAAPTVAPASGPAKKSTAKTTKKS